MLTPQRLLICGSRRMVDAGPIRARLLALPRSSLIIHGAGDGADTLADMVALELGFPVMAFEADWTPVRPGQRDSPGAGPAREPPHAPRGAA